MKYLWQDGGFPISLCTIIGRRPVMSSHLNSRYWARLSVTSDFSDSLAGLCYELIRFGGIIFADYAGLLAFFTLILINPNNVLQRLKVWYTDQKIRHLKMLLLALMLLLWKI